MPTQDHGSVGIGGLGLHSVHTSGMNMSIWNLIFPRFILYANHLFLLADAGDGHCHVALCYNEKSGPRVDRQADQVAQ